MTKYFKYFWYIIRHKWFVMLACFDMGLYWQGIVHDLSKLLPSEFFPYANFFYGKKKEVRDSTGYYKPTDTGDKAMDFAWLLHQKRNKHHWQWWVLPEDNGESKWLIQSNEDIGPDYLSIENKKIAMFADWDSRQFDNPTFGIRQKDRDNSLLVKKLLNRPNVYAMPIPMKYLKEMLCDWIGAGKAQGKPDIKSWWDANNHKMQLHPESRTILGAYFN